VWKYHVEGDEKLSKVFIINIIAKLREALIIFLYIHWGLVARFLWNVEVAIQSQARSLPISSFVFHIYICKNEKDYFKIYTLEITPNLARGNVETVVAHNWC